MLAPITKPNTRYRLLAARHAGATFGDAETLRNEPFEALLEERDQLLARLEAKRDPLVDALYAEIPKLTDPGERRKALKLKRNVFNGRPLGPFPDALPEELATDLEDYGVSLLRSVEIFDALRESVMSTARERLSTLTSDGVFLAALACASPDLSAELARDPDWGFGVPGRLSLDRSDSDRQGFSNTEKALYSYATRFFSKANPFHLFAAVQLPELSAGLPYELGLEPKGLLDLEQELVVTAPAEQVSLSLSPSARHGDRCLFWHVAADGLKIRVEPWEPGLAAVHAFFEPSANQDLSTVVDQTVSSWNRYLGGLAPESQSAAGEAMDRLRAEGTVQQYLISDLRDLRPLVNAASHADEKLRRRAALAGRYHLTRLNEQELAHAEKTLNGLRAETGFRHFVNRYADEDVAPSDPAPFEDAAQSVASDLSELKPIFLANGHNFSKNDTVMRAYLKDYLSGRPEPVSFLEILTHFLTRKREILTHYQPDPRSLELRRVKLWREKLAAIDGSISGNVLKKLVDRRPAHAFDDFSQGSLCFNGPFDFESGVYTVSNIFGGHGHFASRYGLGRSRDLSIDIARRTAGPPLAAVAPDRWPLSVELAVPPVPSMNFVVPAFVTGTGFEPRYRHRYETWIEPAEILLSLELDPDGRESVVYRRKVDGQRLKFHYRGFMLSHMLPAEHQLLLLGHGDSFGNPFLRSEGRPGAGELRHDPEVRYGHVRLRRECWVLSAGLLRRAPDSPDPLKFAALFRDWLFETLDHRSECWFYRTLGGPEGAYKPRYLDLRNPLGMQAFRRSLSRLPKTAALSFTVLDPTPERLLGARMRELMIEV